VRICSVVSAGILVTGLAVVIPSTIVASSQSVARHRDCSVVCYRGGCNASGDGKCYCYCDASGNPICYCQGPY